MSSKLTDSSNRVSQILNRPKKVSRHVNIQSICKADEPGHKSLPCRRRNDSTQIINVISDIQPEQKSQIKENLKNLSNIGPSCFSITYEPHVQKEIKPGIKKKPSNPKSSHYKPYLAEIQPEYIDSFTRSKSLQEIKDINKKFNIVTVKKSNVNKGHIKKTIFSPIKLCDEEKFSKHFIKMVRPSRASEQLILSNIEKKPRDNLITYSPCNCCHKNDVLNKSESKNTSLSKGTKVQLHRNTSGNTRTYKRHEFKNSVSNYKCSDCSAKLFNENNSRESLDIFKKYLSQDCDCYSHRTNVNFCQEDLSNLSDSCESHSLYGEEKNTCLNCPCPLHNIIKFRHENFPDTHASPNKQTKSQPSYDTYILDDRLFPVLIQSNQKETNDIKYSKESSTPELSNLKSFVTLKPTLDPTLFPGKNRNDPKFSNHMDPFIFV